MACLFSLIASLLVGVGYAWARSSLVASGAPHTPCRPVPCMAITHLRRFSVIDLWEHAGRYVVTSMAVVGVAWNGRSRMAKGCGGIATDSVPLAQTSNVFLCGGAFGHLYLGLALAFVVFPGTLLCFGGPPLAHKAPPRMGRARGNFANSPVMFAGPLWAWLAPDPPPPGGWGGWLSPFTLAHLDSCLFAVRLAAMVWISFGARC